MSTLQGWWTTYQKYGMTSYESTKLIKSLKKKFKYKRQRAAVVVNGIIELAIKRIITQFQLHLEGGDPWLISRASIWRVMTGRIGWSHRLYQSIARQREELLRQEYRDSLRQFHDPAVFVFLDETQRNKDDRRKRCWAPRGADNTLREFLSEGLTYMLLAACDINGMVLEMCDIVPSKRSSKDRNTTRGTVDTERFLLYLDEKVVPFLGNAVLGQPRSVAVMDNAPIHQDPRVRQKIHDAGAVLIYCAPYSPDLNPIEPTFHQYKAYLRRNIHTRCLIWPIAPRSAVVRYSTKHAQLLQSYRLHSELALVERRVGGTYRRYCRVYRRYCRTTPISKASAPIEPINNSFLYEDKSSSVSKSIFVFMCVRARACERARTRVCLCVCVCVCLCVSAMETCLWKTIKFTWI